MVTQSPIAGDPLRAGVGADVLRYHGVERRKDVRVELPFPAIIRGVDATGDRFEEEVVLDSLSVQGLSLRLRRPIAPGSKLFICIKLWLEQGVGARGPRAAARGRVLRSERQPDGRYGIAVVFDRYRFLYAAQG